MCTSKHFIYLNILHQTFAFGCVNVIDVMRKPHILECMYMMRLHSTALEVIEYVSNTCIIWGTSTGIAHLYKHSVK